MKERCLNKSLKDKARRLTRSVFEDAAQKNLSQADSPEYQQALRLRQIWCEGTFAIQKWSHKAHPAQGQQYNTVQSSD